MLSRTFSVLTYTGYKDTQMFSTWEQVSIVLLFPDAATVANVVQ